MHNFFRFWIVSYDNPSNCVTFHFTHQMCANEVVFNFFRIHQMMSKYMYFETVVFNLEKLKHFCTKRSFENHYISKFWWRGTAPFLPHSPLYFHLKFCRFEIAVTRFRFYAEREKWCLDEISFTVLRSICQWEYLSPRGVPVTLMQFRLIVLHI